MLVEGAIWIRFTIDLEFRLRAFFCWQWLPVNTPLICDETPALVVGFQDSVSRIFDRIRVVVISSQAKGIHQAFRVGKVGRKERIPRADHHICLVILKKFHRLHGAVERQHQQKQYRHYQAAIRVVPWLASREPELKCWSVGICRASLLSDFSQEASSSVLTLHFPLYIPSIKLLTV